VTEQFLNDFGVLSIGIQDRAEGVTKRVPANTLLVDSIQGWPALGTLQREQKTECYL
jgi:hypothetical protein